MLVLIGCLELLKGWWSPFSFDDRAVGQLALWMGVISMPSVACPPPGFMWRGVWRDVLFFLWLLLLVRLRPLLLEGTILSTGEKGCS